MVRWCVHATSSLAIRACPARFRLATVTLGTGRSVIGTETLVATAVGIQGLAASSTDADAKISSDEIAKHSASFSLRLAIDRPHWPRGDVCASTVPRLRPDRRDCSFEGYPRNAVCKYYELVDE